MNAVSYPAGAHATFAKVEAGSFWFRHRNACILDLLQRKPPGGTVWDIGGGNGFVSLAMQRAGHEVVLVEPGEQGAATAETRGVKRVVRSTFQELDPKPDCLDAAAMFDVLEHIEHDRDFLRTLANALRTDGRLYLTVPAYQWQWSAEDTAAGHYRRYSVRSLNRTLTASGFAVEFASPFFAPLVPPLLALRTIPSALGLRRSVNESTTAKEHTLPSGFAG
ncbi:MAG: class I SAM-dependent methyltransferase, partial [Sphingobium sp.]